MIDLTIIIIENCFLFFYRNFGFKFLGKKKSICMIGWIIIEYQIKTIRNIEEKKINNNFDASNLAPSLNQY